MLKDFCLTDKYPNHTEIALFHPQNDLDIPEIPHFAK